MYPYGLAFSPKDWNNAIFGKYPTSWMVEMAISFISKVYASPFIFRAFLQPPAKKGQTIRFSRFEEKK